MFWDVFYDGKWLDSVWYEKGCTADYVIRSLIDHDGFPCGITLYN